jgi:hypothetical protein
LLHLDFLFQTCENWYYVASLHALVKCHRCCWRTTAAQDDMQYVDICQRGQCVKYQAGLIEDGTSTKNICDRSKGTESSMSVCS